jgi:hypothetical protein
VVVVTAHSVGFTDQPSWDDEALPDILESGIGVTQFDPASGATFSSSDLKVPGGRVADVYATPIAISLAGRVHCSTGRTANLTISGSTEDGTISGSLADTSVIECTPATVHVRGTLSIGGEIVPAGVIVDRHFCEGRGCLPDPAVTPGRRCPRSPVPVECRRLE